VPTRSKKYYENNKDEIKQKLKNVNKTIIIYTKHTSEQKGLFKYFIYYEIINKNTTTNR